MITAEQFAEWKTHPVTKEIFKSLTEIKEEIKAQLANGNTVGGDAEATHGLTSRAVGHIDGLDQLLNISFEDGSVDEVDNQNGY